MTLPYAEEARRGFARFLMERPWPFFNAGWMLLLFGLTLFVGLIVYRPKKLLRIKMEGAEASNDEGIIRDYVAH